MTRRIEKGRPCARCGQRGGRHISPCRSTHREERVDVSEACARLGISPDVLADPWATNADAESAGAA